MVKSILNNNFEYPETKTIEINDKNTERDIYKIRIFDRYVEVTFGSHIRIDGDNSDTDNVPITYFPIYLIKSNGKSLQIGVFEILNDKLGTDASSIDDFSSMYEHGNVLLYSFASEQFISNLVPHVSHLKEETEEDEAENIDKFNTTNLEQNKPEANQHTKNIIKFMQNVNYAVVPIAGNGDCFFTSIMAAYKTINETKSVEQLRRIVSDAAKKDIFDNYTTQYNEINTHNTNNPNNPNNMRDFLFMKNVSNIEQMKHVMLTPTYWADHFALMTIEQTLNIQLIIFNEQNNIICQKLQDESFNPDNYILLNYTGGNHYELITYRNKGIFNFSELPYGLKVKLVNKCIMNHDVNMFDSNQEFFGFKQRLLTQQQSLQPAVTPQTGGSQIIENSTEYGEGNLWNKNVKLFFNDKSSDIIPGHALGEKIPRDKIDSFSELAKIKNWRKKLDNFWIQPFVLDEKTWASVEHYYQGSKFKNDNPNFYDKFSMDSNSSLSNNPSKAKKIGENIDNRPAGIDVDEDYTEKKGNLNLYSAQEAKFTQHDDLAKMLLATNKANLYYRRKENYPVQNINLMIIRKKIQSEHNN
jgi:predicted NAD-dependent protein-ADP-ribosyltransferase YbiA (DUF1768 family)